MHEVIIISRLKHIIHLSFTINGTKYFHCTYEAISAYNVIIITCQLKIAYNIHRVRKKESTVFQA